MRFGWLKWAWPILFILAGCRERNDPRISSELKRMLFQKDYFRLRDELGQDSERLDKFHRIFYRAFVENAFHKDTISIGDVRDLISNYRKELSDSEMINLLGIQEANYYNTFQYRKAARTDEQLINDFSKILNPAESKIIQNSLLIWKALSGVLPESVSISGNSSITWTRDALGLVEVPIICGDSAGSFIFDTRANISTITKSYATRLRLHRIPVSFDLGSGITGKLFKSELAFADSLQLGGAKLKHVVFQVVSDSMLYIAPIHFTIHGIFGFAAMEQLGQVEVDQDGKMTIPGRILIHPIPNIALDGYDVVIRLGVYGDSLSFFFDSGASSSDLYNLFFQRYKSRVLKDGKLEKVQLGGAGGSISSDEYVLPRLSLSFMHYPVIIKNAHVLTRPVTDEEEKFYGNIGQDFIRQYNEMTINFRDMYVDFH